MTNRERRGKVARMPWLILDDVKEANSSHLQSNTQRHVSGYTTANKPAGKAEDSTRPVTMYLIPLLAYYIQFSAICRVSAQYDNKKAMLCLLLALLEAFKPLMRALPPPYA